MKQLLIARRIGLPRQQNATALWGRIVENSIVDGMWQAAILSTSGPRNHFAHPTGTTVTEANAEYSLAAAGLAIRMLAAAWP